MNSRTQKLTYGAMIVAIFGVMLLINRQTGNFFAELLMFILPIPMVAYSARYGFRDSIPVFICTVLISFLYGGFNIIFYSVSASVTGTVFGTCLHRKVSAGHTMLLVMVMSAISNVLSSVVLLSFYGMDLTTEITAMQTEMGTIFEQANMAETAGQILTYDYLVRMYVISMIVLGIVQGFLVYELSLILLRKLKYPVPKPQPISSFYPPKWTGYLALMLFIMYYFSMAVQWNNDYIKNALMSAGTCGYLYLVIFGAVAATLFFRMRTQVPKVFSILLIVLCMFTFPYLLLILGYLYLSGNLHDRLLAPKENR